MVTEHMRCEPSKAARKESPFNVDAMRVSATSCLLSSEVLEVVFVVSHGLKAASRVAMDHHAKIRKMSASRVEVWAAVGT